MIGGTDLLTLQEDFEYDQWIFEYCKKIIDNRITWLKSEILTEKLLRELSLKERYKAIKKLEEVRLELYRIIKFDYRSDDPNLGSTIQFHKEFTANYEYFLEIKVRNIFDPLEPWDAVVFLVSNLKLNKKEEK